MTSHVRSYEHVTLFTLEWKQHGFRQLVYMEYKHRLHYVIDKFRKDYTLCTYFCSTTGSCPFIIGWASPPEAPLLTFPHSINWCINTWIFCSYSCCWDIIRRSISTVDRCRAPSSSRINLSCSSTFTCKSTNKRTCLTVKSFILYWVLRIQWISWTMSLNSNAYKYSVLLSKVQDITHKTKTVQKCLFEKTMEINDLTVTKSLNCLKFEF